MAALAERLQVRTPVAVVFSTRPQLLEAVITLPEQLRQIGVDNYPSGNVGGYLVFAAPRAGIKVPNLTVTYHLPPNFPGIAPSDATTPNFELKLSNWRGMDEAKLKQASDEMLRGGRPARAITALDYVNTIERFGIDFFPRLLSMGYKPDYASFSGIRTRLGYIEERVTLAYKGVILDQEVPTISVGRRGHPDRWVERVIKKFGAPPSYDIGG